MLSDLRLQHFRSYNNTSFELSKGVNIVVGPNASGKTNLLEAILVLCRGNSYRVKDTELIQFENPWARLDANIAGGTNRTVKLFLDQTPSKLFNISGKEYKRLPATQTLPVVLFEPNHLQLLSGSPERRRDYLDDLLEQTMTSYGAIRRQYKRALAQRNTLLKNKPRPEDMFVWNVRISQLAGQIVRHRTQITKEITKKLTDIYKELSQANTKVTIEYQNRWQPEQYETKLLKELETNFETDVVRGFTTSGPHREDLVVFFDDHPAQETASRGETRTAVLALKIIEVTLIEAARDKTPILLLDDVFSELDGKRRHALTNYLEKYQTFITTTDADLVVKNFTQNCNIIALV